MTMVSDLFAAAQKAFGKAYAPYSKFCVGAAILGDDGKIYNGCNVENVSYPCGTCAEAGAIAAMIAGGSKSISEILILADSRELIKPCGACLQRIAEFAENDTLIHLANLTGVQQTLKLSDLMPLAFAAQELSR
ncbi:MAG: cytidine deaminase [Alphaproteobacteria bacterium]|nr:cytidine deaminase [Alphaproteobacteria bacterium]